MEKGTGEG